MTGRELPEKYRHIAARVPAYPVFGTLFSARLGWPGSGQGDTRGHRSYWRTSPFLLASAFVRMVSCRHIKLTRNILRPVWASPWT